ncbi:hypothetical protein PN466_18095 [Roseofilum reptotaenium CS-1145]|uniref:hypothetical protein n=1 Tax=Roseofilum reptotaenium TaxID=1233427 RepID=UPI000AB20F73|nr:hypothetical protein [Roseofilum reptotaenium]MDB9518860.1 hypothetical protein [Roseofilum reptotaenium CS-1145]
MVLFRLPPEAAAQQLQEQSFRAEVDARGDRIRNELQAVGVTFNLNLNWIYFHT